MTGMPDASAHATRLLLTDRGLVESPRWHDGRLWFADWTAGEILTLDANGQIQTIVRAPAPPLSFDFGPDGTMYVVAAGQNHLLYLTPGGALKPFAPFGERAAWNEIVVDRVGNIYVNGPRLLLIRPDRKVEIEAEGFEFPNGMAIADGGRTLVCAESWARRLTAFDIAADGHLINRRVWADLPGPPDGICFDASDSIWYADVPNGYCRRVREGGEMIEEVKLDRGAFACMLGGASRRTLYIASAKWFGMDRMADMAGHGQIRAIEVSVRGAGLPFN